MFYTFRTAIECYQRCPRRRYWQYHYGGTGIVPDVQATPLSTGTIVHQGIELMLRHPADAPEIALEHAAREASTTLWEDQYTRDEQTALIEGLLLLFYDCVFPALMNRYHVVDVEREEALQLTDQIVLLGRVDAILQDKETKDLLLVNFKTSSTHPLSDGRKEHAVYHDLQNLVEFLVVSERLRAESRDLEGLIEISKRLSSIDPKLMRVAEYATKKLENRTDRVHAIQMIYLIKGTRRWITDDQGNKLHRVTYSPLIRAYYGNGKMVPSYKSGYRPVSVWTQPGGVRSWYSVLSMQYPEVLKDLYFMPHPFYQSEEAAAALKEEIVKQETKIMRMLQSGEKFPMYRHSCYYPTFCDYIKLCHEGGDPTVGYVRRTPHHKLEAEHGSDGNLVW